MRLLVFNLATDLDDPILGFTTSWINAIARKVDHIDVITMRSGRIGTDDSVNVFSLGKEKQHGKLRRFFEFYRHLIHIFKAGQIDACFSHMNPLFTVLAAPILKAKGIPTITWYAHPSITPTLKLAHLLSDRMIASVATAYPHKKDKLVVVGQGIDTNIFVPLESVEERQERIILCAGRISPVKDHPTLLKAVALMKQRENIPLKLLIVGSAPNREGEKYAQELHELTERLGIQDIVQFIDGVPMEDLPFWYQQCDVHVNLTPTGFGDKVAWEAMSCGKPCILANEGFKETLGIYADSLTFQHGCFTELADRLSWLLSQEEKVRISIGMYLRRQVVDMHSLENLSLNIVTLFKSLKASNS